MKFGQSKYSKHARDFSKGASCCVAGLIAVIAIPLFFAGCYDRPRKTNLKPGTRFAVHDVVAADDQNAHDVKGAASNLIEPPLLTQSDIRSASVATDDSGCNS
jgi:hypothetical protein